MKKIIFKPIAFYYFISLFLFLSGYAFYIFVRNFDPLFSIELNQTAILSIPDFINNSYATFSHVLALSLFCYALIGAKHYFKLPIIIFWTITSLILELFQLYIIDGTYDVSDLIAILISGTVFLLLTQIIDNNINFKSNSELKSPKLLQQKIPSLRFSIGLPLVGVFGIWTILGSSGGDEHRNTIPIEDFPIYMSYQELRAQLKIEIDRELVETGKIYIYQNILLVNEPNKGIHIYDNAKPRTPVHKVFINLPGNLDIAVRNGYLYADSFIDLVVININDLNNIYVSQRTESVFPYDPYQAVRGNARTFYRWDKSQGVIIGVKAK